MTRSSRQVSGVFAAFSLVAYFGCSDGSLEGTPPEDSGHDGTTGGSNGSDGGLNIPEGSGGTNGEGGAGAQCVPSSETEIAENGRDDDCDGFVDNVPCGEGIELDSSDPFDAARAMGLCTGVKSARYTSVDGEGRPIHELSHGVLGDFGPNVASREGTNLLALSSGTARRPSDSGYSYEENELEDMGFIQGTRSNTPEGYPIASTSCPDLELPDEPVPIFDTVALEVELEVPENAQGFAFDFNFYTREFPVYVCSIYNDFFVALMDPAPEGAILGNISFDSQGNSVSVNAGFVQVCQAQEAGGKEFECELGTQELQGTGFENDGESDDNPSAATGWLVTESPAEPGSTIRLRFGIWDTGDPSLDSTVLVDNFRWLSRTVDKPGTVPVVK